MFNFNRVIMKKLLLTLAVATALIGTVSAQEEEREMGTTTKSGRNILPAAGDFAIGVEANPFLEYIGNIFTNGTNNAPSFDGSKGAIIGKYFLTDKSAVRARLGFDFGSTKETTPTTKLPIDPNNPDAKVNNTTTTKKNNFALGVGYELRRGYGRLQGFYGGEALIGFRSEKDTYTYGNALSAQNGVSRVKEEGKGSGFEFGVGGFAGVEYFVAPKISLGGELGLAIMTDSGKGGKTITETWDSATSSVKTTTVDNTNNKTSTFNFGTRTSGKINLTFHF